MCKTFYLTTAIDYVNGRPHLGHVYEKVCADAIARFRRLQGREVFFITGADEHSLNVARAAAAAGLPVGEYCDGMTAAFQEACKIMGISYDRYIRTTDEDHVAAVQRMIGALKEGGHLYLGRYQGWYCPSCEAFLEADGGMGGECPVHPGKRLEWVEEENWFFALSQFQEKLLAWIEDDPCPIRPASRRNEIVNRLRGGLRDISISRASTDWGVPLPWDETQVIYVWCDALINYLTGAGYGSDADAFARRWPADCHIVGKDITWFHCVIWPAMLMAAGLPLPRCVFGHGFINRRGVKLSKSLGNAVDPLPIARKFGVDALRYYLLREVPWGGDGEFSEEALIKSYNSDLANDFGNLLSRWAAMTEKYCDGLVPAPGARESIDGELPALAQAAALEYEACLEEMDLSGALAAIWRLLGRANKYADETAPWRLAAEGDPRLGTVLYNLAEVLRITTIAVTPFLVEAPARFWRQLGLAEDLSAQRIEDLKAWGKTPPGTRIRRGEPVFPRIK